MFPGLSLACSYFLIILFRKIFQFSTFQVQLKPLSFVSYRQYCRKCKESPIFKKNRNNSALSKNKSEITKLNSNLLLKSKSSIKDKLVNELERLRLDKIGQKTVCSLILTTTQISTPFGYPVFSIDPQVQSKQCLLENDFLHWLQLIDYN